MRRHVWLSHVNYFLLSASVACDLFKMRTNIILNLYFTCDENLVQYKSQTRRRQLCRAHSSLVCAYTVLYILFARRQFIAWAQKKEVRNNNLKGAAYTHTQHNTAHAANSVLCELGAHACLNSLYSRFCLPNIEKMFYLSASKMRRTRQTLIGCAANCSLQCYKL